MIDLRKLLILSLKYWKVYVISVFVCLFIAGVLYISKPGIFVVDASLMLRQGDNNSGESSQGRMIKMMGGDAPRMAIDEMHVLSSRSLIEPIVKELGLTTSCEKRHLLKWINTYPEQPFNIQLNEPLEKTRKFKVVVKEGSYSLKGSTSYLTELTEEYGLQLQMNPNIEDGIYRIILRPLRSTVAAYQEAVSVTRGNRESNIIIISMKNSCPALAIDFINRMLDDYNLQSAVDKNLLASQTDVFLSDRLNIITAELNQSEAELEEYERVHHITNLNSIAAEYRKMVEDYDKTLVGLDNLLRILNNTEAEITKPENQRSVFPYIDNALSLLSSGGVPTALTGLISSYNASILRLNDLLKSLNEDHPLIVQELELVEQKRADILSNIVQTRETLILKRENVLKDKSVYQQKLEDVPEQDRIYREMKRTNQTKERQYMYLIQRREENAMLLASNAIPAITIDRAQANPKKVAPKASMYGLSAIILGMLFAFLLVALKEIDFSKLKEQLQ